MENILVLTVLVVMLTAGMTLFFGGLAVLAINGYRANASLKVVGGTAGFQPSRGRRVGDYVIFGVLLSLILICAGVLVWQAWLASPSLSPAQLQLLAALDWLLKGAVGALMGFLACWARHPRSER